MKKAIFIIFFLSILLSCSSEKSHNNPTIYVTITPLKALIEEITCGDFDIDVVVPEGAITKSSIILSYLSYWSYSSYLS